MFGTYTTTVTPGRSNATRQEVAGGVDITNGYPYVHSMRCENDVMTDLCQVYFDGTNFYAYGMKGGADTVTKKLGSGAGGVLTIVGTLRGNWQEWCTDTSSMWSWSCNNTVTITVTIADDGTVTNTISGGYASWEQGNYNGNIFGGWKGLFAYFTISSVTWTANS